MKTAFFTILTVIIIGVTNASSETVNSDLEAKQLIPALEEIEARIKTDGKLSERNTANLRNAVKLWAQGISSMDIRPQFWRVIRSAARKGSPVVLEELGRIVQTPEINREIKSQAISALADAADPAHLSLFEEIAKDPSQHEDIRSSALDAVAYLATPKSEVILQHVAKNETNEFLARVAQTWAPIAKNIMVARNQSREWAERREAIKYLSENLVPGFATLALDNIMASEPKHADEIKEIRKKGNEIVSKKLKESGALTPEPVKP